MGSSNSLGRNLFELRSILDNPLFYGFGSGNAPSLLGRKPNSFYFSDSVDNDFRPESPVEWDWNLEPLSTVWRSFEAEVDVVVTAFNDFPGLDSSPAFSDRAATILADFLKPNGELLPFTYNGRTYYAYNCLKIVEILDHSRLIEDGVLSSRGPGKTVYNAIAYLGVIPERTIGLSIFRMRELPFRIFVTDLFVDRVREHGLNGFDFVKAWPMPEGSNYGYEYLKNLKQSKLQLVPTEHGLQQVKRESMMLEFRLAAGKATSEEKKLLARYRKELDAQLLVRNLDDNYFGFLEEWRTRKGISRLILSCPDSELLFRKLQPWLESLDWPTAIKAYLKDAFYMFEFDNYQPEGKLIEINPT